METPVSSSFNGWACPQCGVWVPAGQYHHNCEATTTSAVSYTFPCCACYAQLQQLIEKLDKLIELLSKGKDVK